MILKRLWIKGSIARSRKNVIIQNLGIKRITERPGMDVMIQRQGMEGITERIVKRIGRPRKKGRLPSLTALIPKQVPSESL